MGQIVLSSEGGAIEMEAAAAESDRRQNITSDAAENVAAVEDAAGSSSHVRWERFLPKLALRVLLVEADDSTRQIIAALLRKCSYKVAAVSDGLKAWEVLKARAENIDLILTEVELPSISGYALLTLIMEHDICKKVPVIMMSSYDSVSIVYKCMLRGAADFLVKPVRKNELRNLWQHVWRKQSSGAGRVPPDESMAQQKIEATAENNATSNHSSQQKIEATAENNASSNHSSGYRACVQRNRECIEKGTDAQSSCTKPELETDEPDVEHLHSLLQPKTNKCLSDDANIYVHKECQEETRKTRAHDNEAGGLQTLASIDVSSNETTLGQDKNSASEQVNVNGQSSMNNPVREAIDLIGAFSNCCKGPLASPASNTSTNKFDILPLLDLSLRGSHPSGSVNQENDETHRINHSDASAFSRYVNKSLQPNSTSRSTCNQQKDIETNSEKQQSNHTPEYTSDAHGSRISSQKYASVTRIQPELPETPFSDPQLKETSQPFPVRGVRFESVINGLGSVMPEMHSAQSGLSPVPSPGAASNSQPFAHSNPFRQADHQPANSQSVRDLLDQRINCTMHQTDNNKQGQEQETFEDTGHVSFANDQSRNSGFYNGYTSHHHSIGSGDIGKTNSISVVNATSDAASEDGVHVHDSTSSRSVQREAALTKFRLKRKERCFEKKVRYESRRKLAEQRPRVRGQFVRHVPDDAQPGS
ncbi:two-component response regulator-like APRR5 isoform X4 [Salvia divinorum]|uniref:Two-component response regulator-like APRR5 isoform X4 n=1 Tax=Salvia divinorum TaxID=28513 RepID=A0ABD1I9U0_SALDI